MDFIHPLGSNKYFKSLLPLGKLIFFSSSIWGLIALWVPTKLGPNWKGIFKMRIRISKSKHFLIKTWLSLLRTGYFHIQDCNFLFIAAPLYLNFYFLPSLVALVCLLWTWQCGGPGRRMYWYPWVSDQILQLLSQCGINTVPYFSENQWPSGNWGFCNTLKLSQRS